MVFHVPRKELTEIRRKQICDKKRKRPCKKYLAIVKFMRFGEAKARNCACMSS